MFFCPKNQSLSTIFDCLVHFSDISDVEAEAELQAEPGDTDDDADPASDQVT